MVSKSKKKQKKYASVKHPTIEAAVDELYYFADKGKAVERLAKIRETFVGKRIEAGEKQSDEEYTLWVRGFGLDADDEEGEGGFGYRGHYARLFVARGEDGLWTIRCEKVPVPLHRHPQRKRPNFDHPDWNYPVMRAIKAGRIYDDYDQALGELETLHIDFPDVTIPGKGKLHLIVYEGKNAESYTKKYILEIKAHDELRYVIEAKAKDPAPPKKPNLKQKRHAETEETVGSFTAKVKGERFRKK